MDETVIRRYSRKDWDVVIMQSTLGKYFGIAYNRNRKKESEIATVDYLLEIQAEGDINYEIDLRD